MDQTFSKNLRDIAVRKTADNQDTVERVGKAGVAVALLSGLGEVLFPGLPFEIGIIGGAFAALAGVAGKEVARKDNRPRTKSGELLCEKHNRAIGDCGCHVKG